VIARRFEEVLATATAVRTSKVRLQKPVDKGSV
jgi:hypothetical protein